MDLEVFESRKRDHLHLALADQHQARGLSGLDRVHLRHEALPDLDFDEIDLSTSCFGHDLATPFYIAGMTAGHSGALKVNLGLAQMAEKRGWAMGLGSLRRDLEFPALIGEWEGFRERFPRLVFFANLGIAQVIVTPLERIQTLLDRTGAHALVIHLNALQEAIQPEGTPQFKGAYAQLQEICGTLNVPVIVKETGCGFSAETLMRLSQLGLAAVDVSGLGGTHWGRIEGSRAGRGSLEGQASVTFSMWGESTLDSLLAAKDGFRGNKGEIWASGGIRSGLDAARSIALGAHRVGYAQPALQAQANGILEEWMKQQEYELKVALFCTGSKTPAELRSKEKVWQIKPA